MNVQCEPSKVKQTKPRAYIVRFVFGGLITALSGYLTTKFGVAVGGLFLGFPAILPASLTLVKKHEGEEAAGDDALGAVAGSIGLVAFGVIMCGSRAPSRRGSFSSSRRSCGWAYLSPFGCWRAASCGGNRSDSRPFLDKQTVPHMPPASARRSRESSGMAASARRMAPS